LLKKIISAFAVSLISFYSVNLSAFTLISNEGKLAHWASGEVNYYLHSSVDEGHYAPFRAAFASWRSVAGLNLIINELGINSSASTSSDGKNTINWITSQWSQLGFRPPSNALAVTLISFNASTGAITDADIFFNSQTFNWGIVGDAGTGNLIDIQNIATHEVGHLLGLDHSSEEFFEEDEALADATMYYASGAGETYRRDLKDDDMSGVRAIYGSDSVATPAISQVNFLGKTGDIADFQIIGANFSGQTSFVLTRGSSSVSDRLARYRTVVSSSEVSLKLDLAGFGNGSAELIAFNSPSAMAAFELTVDSNSISATSRSGGGGCTVRADGTSDFSWVTFYFALLSSASLLIARRRYQRREAVEQKPEY